MFVAVLALVASFVAPAPPAPPAPIPPVESAPPTYRPPLDRSVASPFDAAHGPYGPGNRGLDYAVVPGDRVGAIGAGTVVFAGSVAGATWVTVLHADGVRSSYGPLASLAVVRGQRVRPGDELGTTGTTFHLGVRLGAIYIDPAALFAGRRRHARLIPVFRRPSATLLA